MDYLQIIVLALIQGVTEFLPISSSAHLILPAQLLGWQDQGLAFDVAVHIGSLLAVVLYFRHDVSQLLQGWLASIFRQQKTPASQQAWAVLWATVPALVVGWLVNAYFEDDLRSITVIAGATIVFGVLLGYADRVANKNNLQSVDTPKALIIGCMQALALIPGTSRSGITMTAALLLGLNREASARFSFLLSIPIIVAAGSLKTLELVQSPVAVDWFTLALGTALSSISAYACIYLFLEWINRLGFMPFVIYRLLLGAVLISFV